MTALTDVPALTFVNPDEQATTYRVCLWAAPGQGKSVCACSAPGPILVLSADRPTAYQFARAYWAGRRDIREVRYVDANTLAAVYAYLRNDPDGKEIRTVIVDPLSNIYDQLVRTAPKRNDGDIDYQAVNLKVLGFLTSLRPLDVNVVLIAHEKLNDGKKGDGMLYPALGGPALINKVLAEMDICAHLERQTRTLDDGGREQARWIAQLQPANGIVCKESTGTDLGPWRIADLSRWFEVANNALAPDADMPWSERDAGGWADIAPPEGDAPTPVEIVQPTPAATVDEAPAEPDRDGPQAPSPDPASDRKLAALLAPEDEITRLRRAADAGMRALSAPAKQRLAELQKAGDDVRALDDLIARIADAMPTPTPAENGATG